MNNELREKVYSMSNSFLPLDRFYNDIELNSEKNYDKEKAYKDLEIVADFILDLQKRLAESIKKIEYLKQVIANWQKLYNNLSVAKTKAIIDYDKLVRNVDKFADKQLAILNLEIVREELLDKLYDLYNAPSIIWEKFGDLYSDVVVGGINKVINQQIKNLKQGKK